MLFLSCVIICASPPLPINTKFGYYIITCLSVYVWRSHRIKWLFPTTFGGMFHLGIPCMLHNPQAQNLLLLL